MSNLQKNHKIYDDIGKALEDLARGDHVPDLERRLLKGHNLLMNTPYSVKDNSFSDYTNQQLSNLTNYYDLRRNRQKKVIGEGEREITTEDEALEALKLSRQIATDLVLPYFNRPNPFSNSLFNDIYNLGLAYLHSIVGAVADGYVQEESAVEAKSAAVEVAKGSMRFLDRYHILNEGIKDDEDLSRIGNTLGKILYKTNEGYIRPFEIVPTTQKHIHHGSALMKKLSKEVTVKDDKGEFEFAPSVIFPIAQGGNELGIRLALKYEDSGHFPIVYPLFYSIKTRRHRYPWTSNDSKFLGKDLEGETILITEDWVTTGNTLRGILNQVENVFPREVRVATLKRDKEKSQVPLLDKYDFYTGEWAIYAGNKTDALSELES